MKESELDSVFKDFLVYLEKEKFFSHHTISAYRRDIQRFLLFLKSKKVFSAKLASYELLIEYIRILRETGYANVSVVRMVNAIRSFFRFLYFEEYIEDSIILDFPVPKAQDKIPEILDPGEVEALLAQADESTVVGLRNKAIMKLLYDSGLRVSDRRWRPGPQAPRSRHGRLPNTAATERGCHRLEHPQEPAARPGCSWPPPRDVFPEPPTRSRGYCVRRPLSGPAPEPSGSRRRPRRFAPIPVTHCHGCCELWRSQAGAPARGRNKPTPPRSVPGPARACPS